MYPGERQWLQTWQRECSMVHEEEEEEEEGYER